jgi:hypothetical protein
MDNPAPEPTLDLLNRLGSTAGALADGRALWAAILLSP